MPTTRQVVEGLWQIKLGPAGSVAALKRMSGARVYMHPIDAAMVRKGESCAADTQYYFVFSTAWLTFRSSADAVSAPPAS